MRAKTAEEIEWDRRRELIKKIFVLFDHDGTKDVVIDEFAALAKVFEGKNMTQQVAKKVFAKLDADNNGAVDEEEFIDFMMGKVKNVETYLYLVPCPYTYPLPLPLSLPYTYLSAASYPCACPYLSRAPYPCPDGENDTRQI